MGSDEKAKLAKANGCDHPIIYTREDFVERMKELTNGEKVPVVYDSIGKDTFLKSLDCLRPLGLMVCFGQASGPIGPVDLGIFAQKGSLFFTRPSLNTYAAKRADLVAMAHLRPKSARLLEHSSLRRNVENFSYCLRKAFLK